MKLNKCTDKRYDKQKIISHIYLDGSPFSEAFPKTGLKNNEQKFLLQIVKNDKHSILFPKIVFFNQIVFLNMQNNCY